MGRIKSALEIALEKTESVKSNKAGIAQFEAKQKGKKLANSYLEGELDSFEDEIKKSPREEQPEIKHGIFNVLLSQFALPDREEDLARVEKAAKGLSAIINESRFNQMEKQLSQILRQYLNEAAKYEEAIKRQYAPKLRQKEEEITRRTGRQFKLDPFQDPEFVAFYNQNMSALKENYQAVINELREETLKFSVQ
ncbi:MAG: hypothetical protein LBH43_20045 [Treponema sp.]|nr:hypothetical protein [Treponema sp.]